MKKVFLLMVMIAGLFNVAMANNSNVASESLQIANEPKFEVVSIDEVPEVVMNAFDASYQNIGILKIESGKVGGVTVFKFSIINYEKKEFAVYFTATGEEVRL